MHEVTAATIAGGGGERAAELLPRLASGEAVGTLAFSERGTGAHFYNPELKAERTNGSVTISGRKSFVTSGGHADVYLVLVQGEGGRHCRRLPGRPRRSRRRLRRRLERSRHGRQLERRARARRRAGERRRPDRRRGGGGALVFGVSRRTSSSASRRSTSASPRRQRPPRRPMPATADIPTARRSPRCRRSST